MNKSDPLADIPANAASTQSASLRLVARVKAHTLGLSAAMLCGFLLFAATNYLVYRGGANTGAHLRLLGEFFPGYTVTFRGSLVGLAYGFIAGYALGWLAGNIYNCGLWRRL